jgi:hypothetical protein
MEAIGQFLSSTIGAISYTAVVFIAGAVFGKSLWALISSKLPGNK